MHMFFFNQAHDRQKVGFNPLPLGSRILLNGYDRMFQPSVGPRMHNSFS